LPGLVRQSRLWLAERAALRADVRSLSRDFRIAKHDLVSLGGKGPKPPLQLGYCLVQYEVGLLELTPLELPRMLPYFEVKEFSAYALRHNLRQEETEERSALPRVVLFLGSQVPGHGAILSRYLQLVAVPTDPEYA